MILGKLGLVDPMPPPIWRPLSGSADPAVVPSIPLGSRYVLGEHLGRGGMGDVFRAWDRAGTPFAAKILRPELARDPGVVGRFVQERAILTALHGEHLVAVHDLVVEGDTLALVMDLVAGADLRRELMRVGAFPAAEAARIGAGVAAALATAHAAGVVHLDVKPENVLLENVWPGGRPAVRLTDFGVARLVRSGVNEPGHRYGTPKYVAPEVAAGEPVGPAADLYSLGVLLYELGSGRPPFDGEPAEVLEAHARRIPGRPAGLPDPLWRLVAGLLAKRPEHRPGPAVQVWATLTELAGHAPPAVFPPVALLPPVEPAPAAPVPVATAVLPVPAGAGAVVAGHGVPARARRRRRGPLAAAAVSLGLGLGAGAWALFGTVDTPSGGTPAAAAAAPADPGASSGPAPAETGGSQLPADPAPAACGASAAGDVPYPGELSTALRGTYVEDVVRVQQRLRERGYDICVDGDYGPRTAEAVSAFQRDNGLPGGGAVGPVTWSKLFGQDIPAQAPAEQAPAEHAPAGQPRAAAAVDVVVAPAVDAPVADAEPVPAGTPVPVPEGEKAAEPSAPAAPTAQPSAPVPPG